LALYTDYQWGQPEILSDATKGVYFERGMQDSMRKFFPEFCCATDDEPSKSLCHGTSDPSSGGGDPGNNYDGWVITQFNNSCGIGPLCEGILLPNPVAFDQVGQSCVGNGVPAGRQSPQMGLACLQSVSLQCCPGSSSQNSGTSSGGASSGGASSGGASSGGAPAAVMGSPKPSTILPQTVW